MAAPILITSTPVQLFQQNQPATLLTNQGTVGIYLGTDSNISVGASYHLGPAASMEWPAGQSLWAATGSPGDTATLQLIAGGSGLVDPNEIASQVAAISAPAIAAAIAAAGAPNIINSKVLGTYVLNNAGGLITSPVITAPTVTVSYNSVVPNVANTTSYMQLAIQWFPDNTYSAGELIAENDYIIPVSSISGITTNGNITLPSVSPYMQILVWAPWSGGAFASGTLTISQSSVPPLHSGIIAGAGPHLLTWYPPPSMYTPNAATVLEVTGYSPGTGLPVRLTLPPYSGTVDVYGVIGFAGGTPTYPMMKIIDTYVASQNQMRGNFAVYATAGAQLGHVAVMGAQANGYPMDVYVYGQSGITLTVWLTAVLH